MNVCDVDAKNVTVNVNLAPGEQVVINNTRHVDEDPPYLRNTDYTISTMRGNNAGFYEIQVSEKGHCGYRVLCRDLTIDEARWLVKVLDDRPYLGGVS